MKKNPITLKIFKTLHLWEQLDRVSKTPLKIWPTYLGQYIKCLLEEGSTLGN